MFKTRITEMLGIKYPILCGGMQWLSRAAFVAEICNAGGIAFITAESLETPEDLREEIRLTRDIYRQTVWRQPVHGSGIRYTRKNPTVLRCGL